MIYNKSAGDFAEDVFRIVNRFYSPVLAALIKVQELNMIRFYINYSIIISQMLTMQKIGSINFK